MSLADEFSSLGLAKILEQFGVGATKNKIITIAGASSAEEIAAVLLVLAQQKKWSLLTDETIEGKRVLALQIGQWGFRISGAQRAVIVIFSHNNQFAAHITSKSIMGQLLDWGANEKNIKIIADFLEQAFVTPEKSAEILSKASSAQPIAPKPSIHPLFWVVMFAITLIFLLALIWDSRITFERTKRTDRDWARAVHKTEILNALLKYSFDHSENYPKSLNELVPQYLSSVPADPLTNTPYEYKQTQNGKDYELCVYAEQVIIKSCTDSGGMPTRD